MMKNIVLCLIVIFFITFAYFKGVNDIKGFLIESSNQCSSLGGKLMFEGDYDRMSLNCEYNIMYNSHTI